MKIKTQFTAFLMAFLSFFIIFQIIYLVSKNQEVTKKTLFVKIATIPDLAISSEAHFVRHRSLSDLFSIFSNSPTLSEFFPSTFVYNYSQIQRQIPSRIEIEKK